MTTILTNNASNKIADIFAALSERLTEIITNFVMTVITLGLMSSLYFMIAPTLFTWAFTTTLSIYVVLFLLQLMKTIRSEWTLDEIGNMLHNYIELRKESNDL